MKFGEETDGLNEEACMLSLDEIKESIINEIETLSGIYFDQEITTGEVEITTVPKHTLLKKAEQKGSSEENKQSEESQANGVPNKAA